MNVTEVCRDQSARRGRVRELARQAESTEPNGIDYVEVEDGQLVITVYFLNKAPQDIQPENIRIVGGVRIRDIQVESIRLCELESPERDDCMRVKVNKFGDFSTYTLKLVNAPPGIGGETPLSGFDPRYAQIDFSFKANCPSDLDCRPQQQCSHPSLPEPEIDYLSKDYSSFRQLILERLSLIMPTWKETHVPDFGIAMVELLAYVGDYLSYYQDAVGTEAYLGTARERISIRRHALLVDYQMHEGCNARAWVCLTTDADAVLTDPKNFYFITGQNASYGPGTRMLKVRDLGNVPTAGYEVFEPIVSAGQNDPIHLYVAHNTIHFYTWHHEQCCLPAGATSATLVDSWEATEPPPKPEPQNNKYDGYEGKPKKDANDAYEDNDTDYEEEKRKGKPKYQHEDAAQPPRKRSLHLKPGDVLIFEERLGPETGIEADADKSHRHAVRLTKVEEGIDPLYDQPILFIEWASEDALPFTLCLSSIGPAPDCLPLEYVSVARGNVILVDHGATQPREPFTVPDAFEVSAGCIGAFEPRETILKNRRFPVTLKYGPVTYRSPFPAKYDLARSQLKFLSRFMSSVRRYVEQLWQQTRDGQPLSKESLAALEIIFGRKMLVTVGLIPASKPKHKRPPDPDQHAAALAKLLERFDELLAAKARRLQVLRERVLSGYTLTAAEENEIREMFGESLAGQLGFWTNQMAGPASAALRQQPRAALPCVEIEQTHADPLNPEDDHPHWYPRNNLLASGSNDRHFVAEIDNDGRAHLRFGDGELGHAPEPGSTFNVIYRVGNGVRGNVGAETISHIVFRQLESIGANLIVRNPLPAQGGVEPESIEEVRLFAPGAFRKEIQRAIIADDYARLAERDQLTRVQRAAADLRWTGSWYKVRTGIDPLGVEGTEPQLLEDIQKSLYKFRRIGHDLAVETARYVPLNIALHVCVLPHYLRGHVTAALEDVFSNQLLPGGKRGFFHPDNLTFGDGIYLSALVAAAQAVEGVESVQVTRLERLWEGDQGELASGFLPLSPREIARVDNDPSFPENGLFTLDVGGGR